ncbi:MAG: hypothetical protein R3B09_01285 [Nannocystaceae bacterium]
MRRRLVALPLLLTTSPALVGCGWLHDNISSGSESGSDDATHGSNSQSAGESESSLSGDDESYSYSGDVDTDGYTTIEPTGADNDPEAECPCAPGTELIYVLSDSGEIWSFDPKTADFDFVAQVWCGGFTSTFSMGVSRRARAWIQYQHGDVYTVDLNDPDNPINCLDPGFEPIKPALYANFGMAFVANSMEDPCDKLYAHSATEPEGVGPGVGALGVIDPVSLELSTIAPINYAWGELTGTGNGRLFAYEGYAPPILTEYDKSNGEVLSSLPLPQIDGQSAFAFAWWGGDFYLFADDDPFGSSTSQVWHLDYDESDGDGQAVKGLLKAPIRIVGAGVSTCVPWGPM